MQCTITLTTPIETFTLSGQTNILSMKNDGLSFFQQSQIPTPVTVSDIFFGAHKPARLFYGTKTITHKVLFTGDKALEEAKHFTDALYSGVDSCEYSFTPWGDQVIPSPTPTDPAETFILFSGFLASSPTFAFLDTAYSQVEVTFIIDYTQSTPIPYQLFNYATSLIKNKANQYGAVTPSQAPLRAGALVTIQTATTATISVTVRSTNNGAETEILSAKFVHDFQQGNIDTVLLVSDTEVLEQRLGQTRRADIVELYGDTVFFAPQNGVTTVTVTTDTPNIVVKPLAAEVVL